MIEEPVTFVCWLWEGWRPGQYDYRHVNRLYAQLKQHMTGKWRLVCVTNMTEGIECQTAPLWEMPTPYVANSKAEKHALAATAPNCFCRLRLFDPATAKEFGSLLVSIDLDVTVYADLRPLLTMDKFKVAINEMQKRARYCGTFWQLRAGAYPEIWSEYEPGRSPRAIRDAGLTGSDQAWFSLKIPDAPTWGTADGVYWVKRFGRLTNVPRNARLVYFAGDTNPWSEKCREKWPNFYTPL